MSEEDRGKINETEEVTLKLERELQEYGRDATLGSAKLHAIHDTWKYYALSAREGEAKKAYDGDPTNKDSQTNLIVARLEKRLLEGRQEEKEITLPGYTRESALLKSKKLY